MNWLLRLLHRTPTDHEADIGALRQVIRYQQGQIDQLKDDKEALRRTLQHWRRLYREVTAAAPEEVEA